jgi:hypothetical protein
MNKIQMVSKSWFMQEIAVSLKINKFVNYSKGNTSNYKTLKMIDFD